jgi:hypothetical protein
MKTEEQIEEELKKWEAALSIPLFKGNKDIPNTAIAALKWVLQDSNDN